MTQRRSIWQYQRVAEPVLVPAAEDVTLDKWWQPLSQPVLLRAPLRAHEPLTFVEDFVTAAVPALEGWWQDLARPRWERPPLREHPALHEPRLDFAPEVLTVDKWFRQLEEPLRVRPPLREYPAVFEPIPEGILSDKWWMPLSEPLRVRPPLREHPAFFEPRLDFALEVVTLEKWWALLETPPAHRRRAPMRLHEPLTLVEDFVPPPALASIEWYRPLEEPVRERPTLPILRKHRR